MTYDRKTAEVVGLQQIEVSDVAEAFDRRLDLEIKAFAEARDVEIVILEADSERILHRSHARYFDDLKAVLKEP